MARTLVQHEEVKWNELASRKLRDIAELINKPYPGIKLHMNSNDNLTQACLILTPEGEQPLHLAVNIPPNYPLEPPFIAIQSRVDHPNVFGSYICATILNDATAYTSAYTLKSIAIQLLSFFSDTRIEQAHGGGVVDRREYYGAVKRQYRVHECRECGFGIQGIPRPVDVHKKRSQKQVAAPSPPQPQKCPISQVPFEVLLMICDNLDSEELVVASKAWSRFGTALHHLIPLRNLQCFTLKKGTKDVNLGVGVQVTRAGLSCEFDLVSDVAFSSLQVRKSIHGLSFSSWLPLAINERHWHRVKGDLLERSLRDIQRSMNKSGPLVNVIYAFMNDVVVKLSDQANDAGHASNSLSQNKSTLTHASEKAVESYFALFHLLVCMALENGTTIYSARKEVNDFVGGKHDKTAVPNLGQFLIARLLSDADRGTQQTPEEQENVTIAIIKEAVVRNVVWMLSSHNAKVGGKPELAYMEPSAVSHYRLTTTYRASKTSYRLLMFQDLMRRTVLETYGSMTLVQIRQELFARHGQPPEGAAAKLAEQIRRIQKVNNFPDFFGAMDIKNKPSAERFTDFLRRSVRMSMDAKYSRPVLAQGEALFLRKQIEPTVEVKAGLIPCQHHGKVSFFPR